MAHVPRTPHRGEVEECRAAGDEQMVCCLCGRPRGLRRARGGVNETHIHAIGVRRRQERWEVFGIRRCNYGCLPVSDARLGEQTALQVQVKQHGAVPVLFGRYGEIAGERGFACAALCGKTGECFQGCVVPRGGLAVPRG